jgi:NAD+ kinase
MHVGTLGIPILGVNVGRLGFLAQTFPKDLIPTTQLLLQNRCKIDERSMLEINSSPIPIFKDAPFGLNEVTLHKSHSNDMIIIHAYVNGEFLNSYWCDGLMISTSTGSTAYSLSCGGPIIMPSSGVFVITPIAPHSLTVRPFIIPNTSVISLEIESRSGQALVAIDSRTELVPDNFEIAVKKANFKAKLVQLPDSNYFNTLRSRLNWGVDSRV